MHTLSSGEIETQEVIRFMCQKPAALNDYLLTCHTVFNAAASTASSVSGPIAACSQLQRLETVL